VFVKIKCPSQGRDFPVTFLGSCDIWGMRWFWPQLRMLLGGAESDRNAKGYKIMACEGQLKGWVVPLETWGVWPLPAHTGRHPEAGVGGVTIEVKLKPVDLRLEDVDLGTSLVGQWLRICLLVQGSWVQSLVQKDLACWGAAIEACAPKSPCTATESSSCLL